MIKAIAIDDEPLALEVIRQYASAMSELQLMQTFENAVAALEYLHHYKTDLVFLDISMPDITGIELVKNLINKPQIIFTTAYKEYALEGFELEATDYLLKPFSPDRFEKAVNKAIEVQRVKNLKSDGGEKSFFVMSDYRMIKIPESDIIYIESLDDYIKIHLTGGQKPVMTLMTLKKASGSLGSESFSRIHRSYIVAHRQISSISSRKVVLKNGRELPMTEAYFEPLNKKLKIH